MAPNWRRAHLSERYGPGLALLLSAGLATGLLATEPWTGVVGFAEVQPVVLAAPEGGTVDQVLVRPGQLVTAGAPLMRLDLGAAEHELAVLRARREAALAEWRLGQSDRAERRSRAAAEGARETAAVAGAIAELSALRTERARVMVLAEQGLAGSRDLAPLEIRIAELSAEVGRRAPAPALPAADLSVDESTLLSVFDARVAALESRLAAAVLHSPVDGRVSSVLGSVGTHAQPGAPLVALVPVQTPRAVLCLSETEAAALAEGARVELRPRAGGSPVLAQVDAISSLVDRHAPRCLPQGEDWGRAAYVTTAHPIVPGQVFDVDLSPGPPVGQTLATWLARGSTLASLATPE